MTTLFRRLRAVSTEDLILGVIALLTVGAFALIAGSVGSELGNPRAADAYYNRLVAGFQARQLHLHMDVPQELANLPDPYDPQANRSVRLALKGGHGVLHDLSYHQGRLHLYFGVAPALLLFWPFHLLTGGWISHQWACAVFASTGFVLALTLLRLVRRRHFPEASAVTVVVGAIALGLGSGLPLTLNRPDIWEVPILCGYALVMLTLLLLWFAGGQPARRVRFLALASLAYGLALGSRPSLLLGAAALLLPLWPERRAPARRLGLLLLAAVGPITAVGLALLAYNHLRFGSPFEFGQRFQLAGVRVGELRLFSPSYLPFNLHAYFLSLPPWTWALPTWGFLSFPALPAGHGGIESCFGLFTTLPFVWLAAALPLAWRGLTAEVRVGVGPVASAATVIALGSALILSCFCGVCLRYESEFGPALLLVATLGALACDQRLAARSAARRVFAFTLAALVLYGLAFTVQAGRTLRLQQLGHLTSTLTEANRPREAVPALRQWTWLAPRETYPRTLLAAQLAQDPATRDEAIRHYEAAARVYQESQASDPGSSETLNNFALLLATQPGRRDEAIRTLEQAVRISPRSPVIRFNLGLQLLEAGRSAEAIAQFETALQLEPNFTPARQVLEKLRPAVRK
jgi:tetratricopeptide (TPR) repeat protein